MKLFKKFKSWFEYHLDNSLPLMLSIIALSVFLLGTIVLYYCNNVIPTFTSVVIFIGLCVLWVLLLIIIFTHLVLLYTLLKPDILITEKPSQDKFKVITAISIYSLLLFLLTKYGF